MGYIKRSILSFVMLLAFILPATPALAAPETFDSPQIPLEQTDAINYVVTATNNYTQNELAANFKGANNFQLLRTDTVSNSTVLYWNTDQYNKQPNVVKQKIINKFLSDLNNSNVPGRDQNRIIQWVQSVDTTNATVVQTFSDNTQTDLAGAQNILLPFTGPVGTILGVLSITIAILLVLSCAWDLAWLELPMFNMLLNRGTQGDLNIKNRPFLVSGDAVVAMLRYEANTSSNVLSYYLRLRASTFVIIGLCLSYIVSNQIWNLLGWLMDAVGKVVTLF